MPSRSRLNQRAIEFLEECFVSAIKRSLLRERKNYVRQLSTLKDANAKLHSLGASGRIDYDLEGMAEAYALKFHLMRADNALVAISAIANQIPVAKWSPILDFGSGTGATAWAMAGWSIVNPDRFALIRSEISTKMVELDSKLWDELRASRNGAPMPEVASDMGQAPGAVIANHVYCVPKNDEDAEAQIARVAEAANRVRPGGPVIILTPNIPEKLSLAQKTVSCLLSRGFASVRTDEWADKPRSLTTSRLHRPEELCALRREIDASGELHGIGRVFREPEYDDPYFGFYGRLDILTKTG